MTTEHHRVRDAIPLPAPGEPLVARADRRDRYPIHVTTTLEELVDRLIPALGAGPRVSVLTDETVDALFGATLVRALRAAGFDPLVRAIPPGEPSKSVEQAVALWDWLAESGAARRDVLVAFGGGVVADLGGWVGSAYMRGIPVVNVPTTLLAQVDGALGGKVAVNHPLAKNLLGAFHQPAAVIANVGFLRVHQRTSPARRAGRGDQEGRHRLARAAGRCIEANAEAILARDPRGARAAGVQRGGDQDGAGRARPVRGRPPAAAQLRPHDRPSARDRDRLRAAVARRGGGARDGRRVADRRRPRAGWRRTCSSGCSRSCGGAVCRRPPATSRCR